MKRTVSIISIFLLCFSLSAQDSLSIKSQIDALQKQYDVNFVYDPGIIQGIDSKEITLSGKNIKKDLSAVFSGTGIDWELRKNFVVLSKEYEQELSSNVDTLEAARITTDKLRRANRTQTGLNHLDASKLLSGYAVMSTPDIVKVLQTMPGVASGSELMSGLYVHGGTGSDNLYLLDGVPLYQVSHLAGLFSSFNSDIVESVDFYKSGFPARYGGRLSSVVDVNTKAGDFNEYHGSFSIGLIDGRFNIGGPIVKGKTSFNVSLRRSWLDVVTIPTFAIINAVNRKYGEKTWFGYSLWDVNGSITHKFSEDNVLRLNLYNGQDRMKLSNKSLPTDDDPSTDISSVKVNWGNSLASLDWNWRFDDKMSMRSMLYYTRYNGKMAYGYEDRSNDTKVFSGDKEESGNISRVQDIGLKTDFWWMPAEKHLVRFGASVQPHFYRAERYAEYSRYVDGNETPDSTASNGAKYYGTEFSSYIEDEMKLTGWMSLNAGLRYSAYQTGRKVYHSLEPRAALTFSVHPSVDIRASYSEMSQFNHQVSSVYMDLPTNLWMPSTESVRPMRSRQVAAGVYARLPENMSLSVEAYWKTMSGLIEYVGKSTLFPPIDSWESQFTSGKGRTWGVEIQYQWVTAVDNLDFSYTLSWSQRHFEKIWNGWYADRFDNRHKINVSYTRKFTKRFDAYIAWCWHSGNRMTVADYMVDTRHVFTMGDKPVKVEMEGFSISEIPFYTRPNNVKIPDYHRMDLGCNWHRVTKRGNESIWNLSIYNVYCRMNPFYAVVGRNGMYSSEIKARAYGLVPIIPSFSYTLKF